MRPLLLTCTGTLCVVLCSRVPAEEEQYQRWRVQHGSAVR